MCPPPSPPGNPGGMIFLLKTFQRRNVSLEFSYLALRVEKLFVEFLDYFDEMFWNSHDLNLVNFESVREDSLSLSLF